MKSEIKEIFMGISPTEEQKDRILRKIKKQMPMAHNRTGKFLRAAIIAAALFCVFAVTVFAEGIGGFFAGVFTKDEVVGDMVLTGVYSDYDGHVEMVVEELLSDRISVRMIVRYKAKDEVGQEWLSRLSASGTDLYDDYGFDVNPDFKDNNTVLYGVNWGGVTRELEELSTETELCFVTGMIASEDDWGTDYVVFEYAMPEGIKSTKLNVATNIEKRTYKMDSSEAPEKLYKPTEAVISPLSLVIYGENLGFYKKGYYDTGEEVFYYQKQTAEEDIDSLYMVFGDGTRANMLRPYSKWSIGGCSMLTATNHSKPESVCIIYSTGFEEPVDPDIISGVELDGVYYPFE